MIKIFSFSEPFLPGLLRCLIGLLLEGSSIFVKIGLSMGVTFGGTDENNGNSTHALLIMRARTSQQFGMHGLTDRTQSETRIWIGTTYAKYLC